MTVDLPLNLNSYSHFGADTLLLRIVTPSRGWPESGPGWTLDRQPIESLASLSRLTGDCLLCESGDLAAIPVDELRRSSMPLILALPDSGDIDPAHADLADAFVFADDDAATLSAVFEAAVRGEPAFQVRDFSDGTARTINALSAEAGRIAEALARLAERETRDAGAVAPIDAALVRRILRSRRDRDRFFPADIFADPAWDMLLDLTAARLEAKVVPVSSLCIAAAVPTTTALRWIRSLTEAGLFERRVDPSDARRTHINLSEQAAGAMLDYLRLFSAQWAPR